MEAGGTGNPAGLRPACDEPCSSGTQLSTPAGCSRSGPAEPLWGWDVGIQDASRHRAAASLQGAAEIRSWKTKGAAGSTRGVRHSAAPLTPRHWWFLLSSTTKPCRQLALKFSNSQTS